MESMYLIIYLIFISGLVSLGLSRSHLLSMILSLEFLMLSGFMMGTYMVSWMGLDTLILFIYLFVVVCEASMGLGILISLVKGFGGEMYSTMSLLQC